jgi:hypothetical protein
MKEVLKWAREQEGVRLAKTDILENQEYVYKWLESEVARQTPGSIGRGRRAKSERPPGRKTVRPAAVGVVVRANR